VFVGAKVEQIRAHDDTSAFGATEGRPSLYPRRAALRRGL